MSAACVLVGGDERDKAVLSRMGRTVTTLGFNAKGSAFVQSMVTYPTIRAAKAVLGRITTNKRTR